MIHNRNFIKRVNYEKNGLWASAADFGIMDRLNEELLFQRKIETLSTPIRNLRNLCDVLPPTPPPSLQSPSYYWYIIGIFAHLVYSYFPRYLFYISQTEQIPILIDAILWNCIRIIDLLVHKRHLIWYSQRVWLGFR